MTRKWFVASALVASLTFTLPAAKTAKAAPAPQYGEYAQQPWEVPPREFNEIQRRGFHDGVEGAHKDYGNNRRPDVNNREEYRDVDRIPPGLREAYRAAFRRGYETAASHLWNGGGPAYNQPQPPPPPPNWDSWGMRGLQSEAQRRGYRDGVGEARRDFQTGRAGDPDDQPEYRNPQVAPQFVDEYREGFMRGYTVTMSQLSGEQSWQQYSGDPGGWRAPERFSEWQRRGFHDGIEGARKDFGNHRRPDPNNRWEYTNPSVPDEFRHEYRQGFRRGYEMAATRLYGGM